MLKMCLWNVKETKCKFEKPSNKKKSKILKIRE